LARVVTWCGGRGSLTVCRPFGSCECWDHSHSGSRGYLGKTPATIHRRMAQRR